MKSTEHAGVLIGETLDKLLTGECNIHDIKTIQVMFRNGMYLTADNRRLWIFKKHGDSYAYNALYQSSKERH